MFYKAVVKQTRRHKAQPYYVLLKAKGRHSYISSTRDRMKVTTTIKFSSDLKGHHSSIKLYKSKGTSPFHVVLLKQKGRHSVTTISLLH